MTIIAPEPITAARIDFTDPAAPQASDFGDVYHARAGAFAQAQHVFLAGNGLPARWAGRSRFTVLETGFGLGNNFLATWAAWRDDPARCEELWFVSIEKHPLLRRDLERAHNASPQPELAMQLTAAWPELIPGTHELRFEQERVRLLLAFGDAAAMLAQLAVRADAIYLDGFSPARNPDMWSPHLLRHLPGLANEGCTVSTWSVAREMRDALASGGFEVRKAPGFAEKRHMTVGRFLCART